MLRLKLVMSFGLALVSCLVLSPAWANSLETQNNQVTFDANGHSTPEIGYTSTLGTYIVYSEYPVVNGAAGNASIFYQTVAPNGVVTGAGPVVVADSNDNQWLDSTADGYITYTLSPTVDVLGNIVLYSTSKSRSGKFLNLMNRM